jgi:GntR family transcriptional regulator/MocR family aminotransferase
VLEAVHGPLSRHLALVPCQAGLHVTTTLRDQTIDDADVVRRAAEAGVVVEQLSQYAVTGQPVGIVMGYGAADPASIRPGLARLAEVLDATPSRPTPPRR